jgi:DNA-binding NtrC family response regulator
MLKSRGNVLIVDNDKDMCRILSDIFKHSGIKVNIAYDGESALAKVKKQPYDLMILDYKLSGISGITVLGKARQIRPNLKIIMISAFGNESCKARAKELGAYAFLDKPFNIKGLVKEVDRSSPVKKRNLEKKEVTKDGRRKSDRFFQFG